MSHSPQIIVYQIRAIARLSINELNNVSHVHTVPAVKLDPGLHSALSFGCGANS